MTDSRHATPTTPPEPDSVCVPGPWRHRLISTNGIHLHVADVLPDNWEHNHPPSELPPLVLLLHGYGEHWWTWHHQLQPIAAAGFHAVAVDLRGYGNSDKPPRGYDLVTAGQRHGRPGSRHRTPHRHCRRTRARRRRRLDHGPHVSAKESPNSSW
ncbi:MAG: alpha/beta fold hydrolase [Lawsonella clevelandensis]